ncbi:site-specific tyrosine recombinase/integron integrase [Thermotalea metallivorans]|uniref:Tyrosine recombinase XerD n=1 Tax=Thermotalea metallivorans TaxID=520762 RepID=A0A140LCM6_9FIRM|nr:site-specific tyrosine recombinase/integron integrase [Thermotalea metallivorans]KXG78301.1 Tyrosine recombinase XerD [Thermotalea metallivorans]
MSREEVVVKVLGRMMLEDPSIDQHKLRAVLEEVLYDYDVTPVERALAVRNDITDKLVLYLASKKIDGLSNLTLENYKRHLSRFSLFIQKNIEDITAMDIRMYLAAYGKTGVKNTTLSTEISILRSFFNWLENEEYINKSPMRKIKQIKIEKRLCKALTIEELELMREACKTLRQRAMLEFFYSTGCRLDEVVKLNRYDIDWGNMSVRVVGKGNKERIVYVSPKSKVHIQKYLSSRKDTCEALFVTERQPIQRLGRRSIEREVAKIGKMSGIEKNVYPHLLRHTTATLMLNNGADLVTVQKILGHEDPSTTQIYAQYSDENVQHEYRKHLIQ